MKKVKFIFLLIVSFLFICCTEEEKQHQITLNYADKTYSITVNDNETFTPNNNDLLNYDIEGWYLDKECLIEYSFTKKVVSDLILYAKINPNVWNVTFICDDREIKKQFIDQETITFPNEELINYDITNWYYDSNHSHICNLDDIINSDITLYAEASLKTFMVRLICNDIYATDYVTYGSSLVIDNNVFEQYNVLGWYTDSSLTNKFDFEKTITSKIILYAKYEIKKYHVTFICNDITLNYTVNHNESIAIPTDEVLSKYHIDGWFTDIPSLTHYDFNKKIKSDLTITAAYRNIYTITFICNDIEYTQKVIEDELVNVPSKNNFIGYIIIDYYVDINKEILYNFKDRIYKDTIIYIKWEKDMSKKVTYNYGYNCFNDKNSLRTSFYNEFYFFLQTKTDFDFSKINVNNASEFNTFCTDWNALGKSDLYGPGDTLKDYFLTEETGGVVQNQPTTTFVGYCYQQGKFVQLLEFLPTFFEYWRTDEGCTCYGEYTTDFFYKSWDALVDTLKFFYFTADTLNSKYAWFNSKRVKHALDNIPGVIAMKQWDNFGEGETFVLPTDVSMPGYEFMGWYNEEALLNKITEVTDSRTVYAKWQKLA